MKPAILKARDCCKDLCYIYIFRHSGKEARVWEILSLPETRKNPETLLQSLLFCSGVRLHLPQDELQQVRCRRGNQPGKDDSCHASCC